MKLENLKIGEKYYCPLEGNPKSFRSGVLIEFISNKRVLLQSKRGKKFICHINQLHNTPDKAVVGRKAQKAARREMNRWKHQEREKIIDNYLEKKIKQLGHSTYVTIHENQYAIAGCKRKQHLLFDTLGELERWVDDELLKLEDYRKELSSYKYLVIEGKDGKVEYFHHLNFIFSQYKIRCKVFRGALDEIEKEKVLNRKDVPEMKIIIAK